MDHILCGSDEDDRLSWKSLDSDYDTISMRSSIRIINKEEEGAPLNPAKYMMNLPNSSKISLIPPPTALLPIRDVYEARDDLLASTTSLQSVRSSSVQTQEEPESEIQSTSAFVYDQNLSCLAGCVSLPDPESDPVQNEALVQLESKWKVSEMKLRAMSEKLQQSSIESKTMQQKYSALINDLEQACSEKEDEIQKSRNRNQTLMKQIESANAKISVLEEKLHRQEQEQSSNANNVSKQLNELELVQNRLLDAENLCDKLKQQLHDATTESERNRREYMKNINERDQQIKLLRIKAPAPDPTTNLTTLEQERRDFRSMIDEMSQKLQHCSPKPQEDYIRLQLEVENLQREKSALVDQVESLKERASSKSVSASTSHHLDTTTTPVKESKTKFVNNLHITPITKGGSDGSMANSRESALAKQQQQQQQQTKTTGNFVSLSDLGFRPPSFVKPSESVQQLLAFDTPPPQPNVRRQKRSNAAAAPFANDRNGTDKDAMRRRELERTLLHLHVEKEHLDAEYAKLDRGGGGRTIRERKRKCSIEDRLDLLKREISALKQELKRR